MAKGAETTGTGVSRPGQDLSCPLKGYGTTGKSLSLAQSPFPDINYNNSNNNNTNK